MSSFISNVHRLTDRQRAFVANSQVTNAQSLANYLPNGRLYIAKNEESSKLRAALSSLALELIRKENALQTIADQYYPFATVDFLEEWERALKIPDECFSVEGVTLDQRQRQVVSKLALDKLITKDDFEALGLFFGHKLRIDTGLEIGVFPLTFPAFLSGPPPFDAFTMIVTFIIKEPAPSGFPYTFPMVFPASSSFEFLECLIIKLSPANVNVIFRTEQES